MIGWPPLRHREHAVVKVFTRQTYRRHLCISALNQRLQDPVQSYVSTSRDPFLNLSIEHHLLQKSTPESAVLFTYVNRPSIILGRNQNPWLEVNLPLLVSSAQHPKPNSPIDSTIDLVRRRSGGGTVFHDEGNVNWTVICPSNTFTRDKHAEMVVRALRGRGIDRARVNERHDIVLDQGSQAVDVDRSDTHLTPYTSSEPTAPRPLKVSGSAYKLQKNRALHHGTCLLNNANLEVIPQYLRSPGKSLITARGVESVSSPVGKVPLSNCDFIDAIQSEFHTQYPGSLCQEPLKLGDQFLEHEPIMLGNEELKVMQLGHID